MDRKGFTQKLALLGVCPFMIESLGSSLPEVQAAEQDEKYKVLASQETVHIRYGKVSKICYCPAANYRAFKPNDIHCECTRNTHKAIFETALRRSFRVDIAESLRRGGQTCHFIVYLT